MAGKRLLKDVIYRTLANNTEQLLAQIEDKSVISFDVFDTLLKRDVVLPTDVFACMEKVLKEQNFPLSDFAAQRVRAEEKARKMYPEREITLAEIYANMPFEARVQQELIQLECQLEIDLSVPNIWIKKIYDHCIEKKKTVYFISDMYLPAEIIKRMLKKNGYTKGNLFVSSEIGSTKHSGKLFSYIQNAEKISFSDWAHIGDSIISDFMEPRRLGIRALLINRNSNYNKYFDRRIFRKNTSYQRLNYFINVHICQYTNPYEQIGYAVLGPLLYGFSCWLEQIVLKDETIVFLAREGALLKKAFEVVSKQPAVYLYTSRRAANSAFLDRMKSIDTDCLKDIRIIKKFHSQKEFAKNCGLSDREISEIFHKNHLEEDAIVANSSRDMEILDVIWPTVKQNVAGQYQFLQCYLEQLDLTEKSVVVDVGWHGTIQALLDQSKLTVKEKPVHWRGAYMGCDRVKDGSVYSTIEKKSFLFDEHMNQRIYDTVINSSPFFESLFLSTEGTTKAYAQDESGRIIPLLDQPENTERINEIIDAIQNAGLQFMKDINGSPAHELLCLDANAAIGNYQALARVPSLETLDLFGDFNTYDGYAYKLVSEHSLGYYLLHVGQFIKDFKHKPGKSWFLKSVFKLPLPYIFMLCVIKKLFRLN